MKRTLSVIVFLLFSAILLLGSCNVMAGTVGTLSTININATSIKSISVPKGDDVKINNVGYLIYVGLVSDSGTVFSQNFPYSSTKLPDSIYQFETSSLAYGQYTLTYKVGVFEIIKLLKKQEDGTWQYEYTYSYQYSLTYSVAINLTHSGGHTFVDNVVEPTCTTGGYTTHTCSICGYSYVDNQVDPLGHDFTSTVTPPTCVKDGYTTHVCNRCGYQYTDNTTPALGHTSSSWIIDSEPTYDNEGIEHKECIICGTILETKAIPKLIWNNPFCDVQENTWYFLAIKFAVSNNLFYGTSTDTFSPDNNMTRAMLVAVLYRLKGQPGASGGNPFTDVKENQWYTNAIIWAAQNGIVTGVGNGQFNPGGNITREQMAAILYRYAESEGKDVSQRGNLSVFPDVGQTSSYAVTALSWANKNELIKGTKVNGMAVLDPQGNATRAQVATILMRFANNIE